MPWVSVIFPYPCLVSSNLALFKLAVNLRLKLSKQQSNWSIASLLEDFQQSDEAWQSCRWIPGTEGPLFVGPPRAVCSSTLMKSSIKGLTSPSTLPWYSFLLVRFLLQIHLLVLICGKQLLHFEINSTKRIIFFPQVEIKEKDKHKSTLMKKAVY